jgi:hypothetical protein
VINFFSIKSLSVTTKSENFYLIDVVESGALLRPVPVAHGVAVLGQSGQHHHHDASLLPNHLPEVGDRLLKRALGGDVSRVAGIVVGLKAILMSNMEMKICQCIGNALILTMLPFKQKPLLSVKTKILY